MQKTTIGGIELVALVDTTQPYAATMTYPDLSDPSRFARHLDNEGRITLNFGCFLLRDGETLLLVDTGWGPEYQGRLLAELAEAGVKPGQVTHVLFTHLHGDHTGWNIDRASGRPIFSSAKYLVPQKDWDHFGRIETPEGGRPSPVSGSFERDVRPLEGFGCLELIDGEHVISGALTAVPTPGHTPGHTSVAIVSGQARGFILGDVVISGIDAEEPDLESVFDGDRPLAVKTRKRVVNELIENGALVGASHLPAPGLGHFVRVDGRQGWQGWQGI
ncbi:MAG: MBL fold metallo-hydrolase [bacterium]